MPKTKKVITSKDFPENQIREYKEAFTIFNSHNPRETDLTVEDLSKVFQMLGPEKEVTEQEILSLIAEVDDDDTGKMDFPKFLKMMGRSFEDTESLTDQDTTMRNAFMEFSKGNDSFNSEDLLETMKRMGDNLSEEECENMMSFIGAKEGVVQYEAFLKVMQAL